MRSFGYGGAARETGESSEKRARYKMVTNVFEDKVLKWSLDDIMNENLFKDKVEYNVQRSFIGFYASGNKSFLDSKEVKHIPERFESVAEYLVSFISPLIEETRAELHNTLESISEAPYAAVNFPENIQPSEDEVVVCKMLVDREHDMGEKREKQNLTLKPKDILILSSRVPQYVEDLRDYMLAVVNRTDCQYKDTDGENENGSMLEVKVYVRDMHSFCSQNSNRENQNTCFGIYLGNLATNLRIWKALHTDLADETTNLAVLAKAVYYNTKDCNEVFVEENEDEIEILRNKHFNSHKLNASQISTTVAAVNAVKNKEHPCIKLIQGPPGTGKTSMLVSLLSVLLHMRCKVLVCAPTNAAISEIAMRFLNLVRSPSDRCPNTDDFPCIFTSSDLVLVGNEERLDVEGLLGDIFLDYRVQRLKNCRLPMIGWRKTVTDLLYFPESIISQYEASQDKDSVNFLQFVREKLKLLASNFFDCAGILLNDYPESISEKQDLEHLTEVVEHFVNLIQNNAFKDKTLRECFCGHEEKYIEVSKCTENFRESVINNKKFLKEALCSRISECMHFLKKELCNERLPPYQDILEICLSRARVVFSTVSSSGKSCMNLAAPFDCLIIDEAAQLKEAESTIALQITGVTHAFLIGDPKQLPATVISKLAEQVNYGRSLFERLERLGHPVHLLNIQYRMHPSISLFPNREFYENYIKNGPNVEMEPYGYNYLTSEMYGAYAFINVKDGKEEKDDFGKSKRNIIEAVVVMYILSKLYKVCSCRGNSISVGVVSPYREQVLYLESKLTAKDEWKNILDIEVKSVDGFQGGEKDIIIISTVRTGKNIGFLSDRQRTNVALTRARFCLWIIGHGPSLAESNSVWAKIVRDAISRKCFVDPSMDPEIVKAIRKAKAELDQLEDLLNKDSVLFNNTIWKVLFSDEFKESFTKIKGVPVRQRVINTILNIANGWRQTRKDSGHADEVLVNEYPISGLYLVWTTDVQRGKEIVQVLKIWNVLRLENLPSFRKRLENIFLTYTPMYIERCKAKRLDRERNQTLPCIWEDDRDFVWYRSSKQSEIPETSQCNPSEREELTLEHARVEESLLLMKFYSLSSGISNQLLTARDGSEIGLQFEVNDEESQIVRFPTSLFILGRSGTGKTTVLTMRLLQKEQQSKAALHGVFYDQTGEIQGMDRRNERSCIRQNVEDGRGIRQMFITVSAKLCSAVRNSLARIDSSLLRKDHTPYMAMHDSSDRLGDMKDIPDSFIDIPEKNFPLVITFYKFLMMLDGSVPYHFFDGEKGSIHGKSIAFMEIMRTREVDYERFNSMYWPHFSEDLKKGLDSCLVFTEIMSHIKGSLTSMNSSNFKMSREDYILMAESRVSVLNSNQREAIYELFLHYEKQKQRNGDFDIADLVNHLHCQLRSNAYLGQKVDFIYVDEVQDLTMAQITLFKYVCSNFHEGYVFAGDTAQTIARGVNFRFQEIRNVFYKEFLESDVNNGMPSQIGMPDLFHLSQNFRTHSGIVKLAQSVVELLYHFFPLAVDRLHPERSLIFGEAPIFLETEEAESLITKIFGHGGNFGSGKYEFGAEQAILVRDDHTKVQVLSQVGKQGLVLTILECKGLEFQDVLLYNFFTGSPLATKWRVIYQFMDQKGFNSFDKKALPKFPKFDNGKHNLLCSELKHLYVAITRAKQRLWIYEENRDFAKSILDYWKEMGIIQLRCLDSSLVESMYVASTFEDWKQKGIQMFNEQNYDMAIICFERARDSNMTKWAKAASLRHSGQRLLQLNPETSKSLLTEAAEIFLSIGKSDSAANCYIVLREYKKAGIIYEEKCGEARLEAAGDCFAEAKCWHNAASAYARAKCVSKCLDACFKGKSFMTGLGFIEVWKKHNCNTTCGRCHGCESVNVETDYLKKCATHYRQKKDTKSMMKFVNALPSQDEIRSFLLRRDYFQELLEVEEAAGNFEKAAEMAELIGDLILEADMREKARQYGLAIKSILFHVQLNSFWRTGNKGWPLQEFPQKNQLLKKVKDIAEKDQSHAYESLQCEGSILSEELYSLPELTEHMIHAKKMRNIRLEIFSLRKVLDAHLNSDITLFQLGQGMSLFRVDDSTKMLLENKISPTTLLFIWDEWKDKLLSSVNALSRYEKRRETEQDICYLEYALEYFGVRKNKNDRFCNAFNSEAFWLKSIDVEFLQRQGNTMQMSIQNFFMSARKFFTMELYSVGKVVIEKVEKLYSFCMEQNCILPIQGALLVKIYQVSESLKNIEHLTGQSGLQQVAKFVGVVKGCKERFFNVFFPLKHPDENMKEFISLREDATSISILQDITRDIVHNMQSSITLGQIGRLQVLLPFLPKDLGSEYGKKIFECLTGEHYWSDQLLWLDMDTFQEISLRDRRMHLLKSFGQALSSTFNNWEKIDYISPHIFLILLEKLFFLASSCEHLLTGLILPRSFFIEFMTGKQGEFSLTWLLQSRSELRFEGSCENFYGLLSHIICQLLSDKRGTVEWIEASNIDSRKYFPELILHLIIMFCLTRINSAGNLPNFTQLLWQIFRDSEITETLPFKFRDGLLQLLGKRSSNRKTFLIDLSKAMRCIDNPLVMINLSKSHESIDNHNDIIILTEESLVCKESVMRAVFQGKDVYAENERNEDIKSNNLLKHIEKDLSSNSERLIGNTGQILESVVAKEAHDYITKNSEIVIHDREKEGVCLTAMSNTRETEEQQKVDSVRTEMDSTSENISFPLFKDDEPSHKLKVNGQHVPWFVGWRMKKWLHFAREKLEEHIPLKDKYAKEALKVFQGKENQFYMENFVSKACPLKAEVDEFMDQIITTIPKVKQGHLCFDLDIDILHDTHEELQKLSELLDPRHTKHEDCDIEWLTNDAIDHTSLKLQESKERLKHIIDLIVNDSQKQEAVIDGTVQVTESKSKQKRKKRPKGQKKKRNK